MAGRAVLDVRVGLGVFVARLPVATLATFFTLGLTLPWRESALERYKMRHLHYGDLPARFEGRGWTLFKRGWWLWLLSFLIITLPLIYPAYRAILCAGG